MPLTREEEAALKRLAADRKAYDNSEGMLLRSGSIARDAADRQGIAGIDQALNADQVAGPGQRPLSPAEAAILQQAKQGINQSQFVQAAKGRLLEAQPQQQQQTTGYPRRTTDTVIEANNIPPRMGGGIGRLMSSLFSGGSSQPQTQQAPQAPQAQQQAPQAPQPQGGPNWAQRGLEGFSAGVQGMSIPQARALYAQAQMKQFEVQDQMRTQAAQQNYPQFAAKMKQFKPFWNQFIKDKKTEDPNFRPGPQTFVEATEAWDAAYPSMAITQTDQDTFNRTNQGMQLVMPFGHLPVKDWIEVRKMGLAEDYKQRAAFEDSLRQMPGNQQDVDYQRQVYEQAMNGGQPQIGQSMGPQGQSSPQIGQAMGPQGRQMVQNPDGSVSTERTITIEDPLRPGQWVNIPTMYGGKQVSDREAEQAYVKNQGVDPETGQPLPSFPDKDRAVSAAEARSNQLGQAIGQSSPQGQGVVNANITPEMAAAMEHRRQFTPFQQMAQQRGLNLQEEMMKEAAKQRAKAKDIPVMSGADANAAMRQRMAPLLTDPTTLNFYGDDQQVSLEQMNKDAEELGKNLRESRKAESREGMQAERLAAKSTEAEKTRTAAANLATMKVENISQNSEKNRNIKMRLAVLDNQYKEARQNRALSQQQQREQYKAEASLNKQREMLQTKAGIAFTLEGMKSDPDQAIKFALEAERAGNATARGLIGDVLETNPALAWPILERLGTLSKENGLSQNSVTAVKGAIEDYMNRKSNFSSEEMAQDIVNGPGTDKDKNTKLAMELRKAKSSGNTQAADYYQFLLDSRKSAGQQITIDNRPPPEGGVGLGKALTKEQTSQLIAAQDGIGLINDLRGYIKSSPIAGVSGLSERIQNYAAGTMYDFSRIQEGVDGEAYRKKFNPDIDPGTLLANKLKYIVARVNDPTGRLSDKDIENVNIGTGVTDNTLSLESTINGLEREMFRVMSETSERVSNAGIKLVPTPSDRDAVIQNFVDDPSFSKYPESTLKIMIQDMFLKGADVMIGKSELNEIIREIKKRRQ